MKKLIIVSMIACPNILLAATWNAEVKDIETSEVKHYSFEEIKTHKIELPKLQNQGCVLEVHAPSKVEEEGHTSNVQLVELNCSHSTGSVIIRKACNMIPTTIEKSVLTAVNVTEDGGKAKTKKGKFASYLITLKCD